VLLMPGLRKPIARVATDSRFAIVLPLTFVETDLRPNLVDVIRSVTVSHGTSRGFLHGPHAIAEHATKLVETRYCIGMEHDFMV
jgi:hypothetical protein